MLIYVITNTITKKQYVGQTTGTLERRWKDHCFKSSRCLKIGRSIQKHGKDNFTVEVLDNTATTMEELNFKEEYYIKHLNTLAPNGYNLKQGGKNAKHSEESIQRMSDVKKGIPTGRAMTEKNKKALSERNKNREYKKGWVHTEETKAKMSAKSKEYGNLPETKEHISNRMKGNKYNLGKTYSEERVEKVASANRGRKHTEEAKQNMREAQQKAWAEGKYKNRPLSGRALAMKELRVGTPHTEETKAKISKQKKEFFAKNGYEATPARKALWEKQTGAEGTPHTEKARKILSEHTKTSWENGVYANRNYKHSEETKARMKEKRLIYNEARKAAKENLVLEKVIV